MVSTTSGEAPRTPATMFDGEQQSERERRARLWVGKERSLASDFIEERQEEQRSVGVFKAVINGVGSWSNGEETEALKFHNAGEKQTSDRGRGWFGCSVGRSTGRGSRARRLRGRPSWTGWRVGRAGFRSAGRSRGTGLGRLYYSAGEGELRSGPRTTARGAVRPSWRYRGGSRGARGGSGLGGLIFWRRVGSVGLGA
jgi:hypothetical protein